MIHCKGTLGFFSWHSVSLLPGGGRSEGRNGRVRSGWAVKIFVAICRVLDLHNCSRLVSGVQHPAILQEIVYRVYSV